MRKQFTILLAVGFVSLIKAEGIMAPVVGTGARSYSLANNEVASANDMSAMFWNPGALSFMPVREFHASADFLRNDAVASFFDSLTGNNMMRFRISDLGLARAIPTARGGLLFAIGYQSPYAFDDVVSFKGQYLDHSSRLIRTSKDYNDYGALGYFGGAFGVQVAHGLGIGLSAALLYGSDHARQVFLKTTDGAIENQYDDNFDKTANRQYLGYDIRLGLLYMPVTWLRIGARVALPQIFMFWEDGKGSYPHTNYNDYSWTDQGIMNSSYTGAIGAAFALPFMRLTTEFRGRAPYNIVSPSDIIPESSPAKHTAIGGGIGLEFPVFSALLLRAGYSIDQLDRFAFSRVYNSDVEAWESPITAATPKHLGTIGLAFLSGGFCLEGSYGLQYYRLTTNYTLQEEHYFQRLLVSCSIRY